MNNKYLWLIAGVLIGLYVVPIVKSKVSPA